MIIQKLNDYYERMCIFGEIAKDGWVMGGLDFVIELDIEGNIFSIEDLREKREKKIVSRKLNLPSIGNQSNKHSNSGKDSNLLWDNASFVFGLGEKGDIKLNSMIDSIDTWIGETSNTEINCVKKFLKKGLLNREHFGAALTNEDYGELFLKGNVKISFKLKNSSNKLIIHNKTAEEAIEKNKNFTKENKNLSGFCLVSGKKSILEKTHPVIKGVWGTQSSGGSIVSFNSNVFNSYYKEQGFNAPISKTIASHYTKALNYLLNSDRQLIHIGDTSIVFWADKDSHFERDFASFFLEPQKDDPGNGTEKIQSLFNSVNNGSFIEKNRTQEFCILGLSPNIARISIRFWYKGTISEYAKNITQFFNDFEIIKPPNEIKYYSIWRILTNISIQDKSKNIPPNLASDFLISILSNLPYPARLLQSALSRIKSDTKKKVKPVRIATIKAYLNRYYKFYPNIKFKEFKMELDKNQPSVGYQIGRLFSTLVKIQGEVNPLVNASVQERFYGAACATPITVFPRLLKLKNHHLAKIENQGRKNYFEQTICEIISHIDCFPSHLTIHEQGAFAIGYYHQTQYFFTKKEDK